jgi:hypothetical protein
MPSAKPDNGTPPVEPQTEKELAVEETALAADISAAHAVVATEKAESDELAAQKAADKNRPACPHCGRLLRFEHDLGDHLHCDGASCIDCCFEPGSDGPVLRPNYPPCPSDKSR